MQRWQRTYGGGGMAVGGAADGGIQVVAVDVHASAVGLWVRRRKRAQLSTLT